MSETNDIAFFIGDRLDDIERALKALNDTLLRIHDYNKKLNIYKELVANAKDNGPLDSIRLNNLREYLNFN